MPERNPFEETATAGSQPGYSRPSQPDTRFGGNLERANIRRSEPASVRPFPSDRNVGGYDPDPTKGKPFPVVENLGSSNLEKLMSMRDPKGLAYNLTNQIYNAYLDEGKYDPYATYGEEDQKILWQSAEMGEPGAVLVGGEWKKPTLNRLGKAIVDQATTGTYDDQGRFTMDPFLGTDPDEDMFTGVPTTLTEKNIPGIESALDELRSDIYGGDPGGPGGPASWAGGYGDDYSDAAYFSGIGQGQKQLGAGEHVPRGLEMLDYMVRLHKENPYTQLAMAKNGGIMSLRR
tara:strand:+ start:556 stop:1422 length:867 start_codon:yes stop_codon:yes gene_type:complete